MRLFLIAGEPSGDRLGAALMDGMRTLAPVAFSGVGGSAMAARGLASLYPMEDLSVMGLAEVIPAFPRLRRRLHQTAAAIAAERPDALVTIDVPDFALRAACLARAARPDLPTVHVVAPSVWAWRPGRAARMAEVIDHVLALLPFEPPLMEAAGMSCTFMGHPVTTELQAGQAEAAAFRAAHAPAGPLLLLLPGSRRGEVRRLGPRFAQTVALLRARHPGLAVALPTVPAVADLAAALARETAAVVLTDPAAKRAAFAAADVALAASGTVSLELAAADTPMVIGYDMAPLSRLVIGRMLTTDTVTLVNLVSGTRAVPEFLGRACRPEAMAPALDRLLADPAARAAQRQAMALTMERLGAGGEAPGLRGARGILGYLERRVTIQPPPSTRLPS